MAATLDLESLDAALKVRYTDQKMKQLGYKNRPTLAMLPKMEGFGGKHMIVPIRYGGPQGRSRDFATAGDNKETSKFEDFVLTRAKDYGRASIDNETLEASQGDLNSFISGVVSDIDGIIETLSRELARDIFSDGSGKRGQIASIGDHGAGTNNVVTLTVADDVVNFEVGQYIVASTELYGETASTAAQVTKVDRSNGKVVFGTTDLEGIAIPYVAGDYLFVRGDYDASGTGEKLKGFDAWIPAAEPASDDSFFSVNRSIDTRLSGLRHDGSSETIEEALQTAAAKVWREGGRPDVVIMHPMDFSDLTKSLGSKVVYDSVKASDMADIGFKAVVLNTPAGEVRVTSDPDCPRAVAWMLQMDTWRLYSLGPAPKLLQADGLKFLREADSDSYEVRAGYYAQLGCSAPGWNCRITLPSAA